MRRMIVAGILAVLAACSSDSTGPNASVTGSYTLRTVNGNNVPAVVFQNATTKDELTAGTLNLNADNTWSGSLTARETSLSTGAVVSITVPASGTYTNNNGSLKLTDSVDDTQLVGTADNGMLTVSGDVGIGAVVTLVFQR